MERQATLKEEYCHAAKNRMKILLMLGGIKTFTGIWEPDTYENIALIIGRQGKQSNEFLLGFESCLLFLG